MLKQIMVSASLLIAGAIGLASEANARVHCTWHFTHQGWKCYTAAPHPTFIVARPVHGSPPRPVRWAAVPPPPPPVAHYRPAPGPYTSPTPPQTTAPNAVVKYGTAAELFKVEGTPAGWHYDGVSSPEKADLCGKKYHGTLVKSNSCRKLGNGQVECKDQCRLPNGQMIGSLSWQ